MDDEPEVVLGDLAVEEEFFGPSLEEVMEDEDEEQDRPSMDPSSFSETSSLFVNDVDKIKFSPYVRQLQQIVLYETKSRFYIIGSNVTSSKFHILKVDRTEPRDLCLSEEAACHSAKEIRDILNMVDSGNCSKVGQKVGSGITKKLSAFGIAGFVRFLEGYYIVFITKRRKAAMIGHHCIYKVEDIDLRYIPNDECRQSHADEARYLRMFLAMDMSSNFYFSYSYDLTNTLQHNMATPKLVMTKDGDWQDISSVFPPGQIPSELSYVSRPNERYMWNEFLTEPVTSRANGGGGGSSSNRIKYEWILPIIHGFVDQSNISIHGRPVLLTIIARRSNRFAGTRFLKRGANFEGDVANDVETEQIVCNSSISDLDRCNITSFVQIRGSVPGHWTQDISKMVPKPQIFFELTDPYGRTSGNHFNYLMQKYGSPIVILNLVKKRERSRRHESLLSDEFVKQIEYLNVFLRPRDQIKYIHLDMARCKKRKDAEVMSTLADIASFAVKKSGIFQNSLRSTVGPACKKKHPLSDSYQERRSKLSTSDSFLLQTGVVRTNCVDCLDRTNTAQFVVAKCALGLQLYALGFLETPELEFNSDCARILETMYEDHGDTLALQYGGSQLIHRIKSYRKESKWTSKANDITQTVRRYYSNTLSDAEKQNTMNLFLGVFKPQWGRSAIWDREITSDHYLHLPALLEPFSWLSVLSQVGTNWWNYRMRSVLPLSILEQEKKVLHLINFVDRLGVAADHNYEDFYRPGELVVMNEMFQFKDVGHSVRDYMPNCCTDYSPFVVRQREVKRREEAANSSKSNSSSFSLANIFSAFGGGGNSNSSKDASPPPSTGPSSATPSSSSTATTSSSNVAAGKKNPSVDGANSSSLLTSDSDDEDLSSSEDYDWLLLEDAQQKTNEAEGSPLIFEEMFEDSKREEWKSVIVGEDLRMYDRMSTMSLMSLCNPSFKHVVLVCDPIPQFEQWDRNEDDRTSNSISVEELNFYNQVIEMKMKTREEDMSSFRNHVDLYGIR